MNENQREAIEAILTSCDRINGLQDGAGMGKTTTLVALKQAVERSGYEIKGYAPTTKAAKQLAEEWDRDTNLTEVHQATVTVQLF